jgi:hypothetical protein
MLASEGGGTLLGGGERDQKVGPQRRGGVVCRRAPLHIPPYATQLKIARVVSGSRSGEKFPDPAKKVRIRNPGINQSPTI